MSQINSTAASARETSRQRDGRFGAQEFDRADLDLDARVRPDLVSERIGTGNQSRSFDALEATLVAWQSPGAVRPRVDGLPADERHEVLARLHSWLFCAQDAVAVAMNESAAEQLSRRAARDAPQEAVALAVVADDDDAREREADTWRRIELVDADGHSVTDGWTALEDELSDEWAETVSRDQLDRHPHQGILAVSEAQARGRFAQIHAPGAPIDTARLIPITGRNHGLDGPGT